MAKFNKEDRAGLYITVIFHLAVIIVLLATQLGFSIARENSFVLDFTKQEQVEKEKKEEVFKEDITQRIERMLAAAGSVPIRNVTVDRGALKDDRGTNAEELYRDALGYLPQDFGYYPDFTGKDFLMYLAALKGLDKHTARRKCAELLRIVMPWPPAVSWSALAILIVVILERSNALSPVKVT